MSKLLLLSFLIKKVKIIPSYTLYKNLKYLAHCTHCSFAYWSFPPELHQFFICLFLKFLFHKKLFYCLFILVIMGSPSWDCGLIPEGSYYAPHSYSLTISSKKLGRNSTNHLLVGYECSPARGISWVCPPQSICL